MGINNREKLELFDQAIDQSKIKMKDIKMCELGNQRMMGSLHIEGIKRRFKHGKPKTGDGFYLTKDYFVDLKGIASFVSIDLNGRDGSLRLDLTKKIDIEKINGPFNVITNFGTSEHVPKQYECFKNIHDLCEIGGIVYHVVPRVGNWDGKGAGLPSPHCPYYYDLDFFQGLADLNDYEMITIKIWNHDHVLPKRAREECVCIYKKIKDQEFIDKEKFSKLPLFHINAPSKSGNYTRN